MKSFCINRILILLSSNSPTHITVLTIKMCCLIFVVFFFVYLYLFVYWINFIPLACNLILLLIHRILSDCIPIKGRKRIPYLVIATVLSLVPWFILGLSSTLRDSTWHLMVLLTAQNLGSAMADVVVDAMIAEAVRYERYVCITSSWFSFSN